MSTTEDRKPGRPSNDERFRRLEDQITQIGDAVAKLAELVTAKSEPPAPIPENAPAAIPVPSDLPRDKAGQVIFRTVGRGSEHQHRVRPETKIFINNEVVRQDGKFIQFENHVYRTSDAEEIASIVGSPDFKKGDIIAVDEQGLPARVGPLVKEGPRLSHIPADEISAPLEERTPVG